MLRSPDASLLDPMSGQNLMGGLVSAKIARYSSPRKRHLEAKISAHLGPKSAQVTPWLFWRPHERSVTP